MDNLASLVVQGASTIICFVAFATVKGTPFKVVTLINTIVCAAIFCANFFVNFAGV